MTANFVRSMLGDEARALQVQDGSRAAYAAMESRADGLGDPLGAREREFIAARDSFYMASVTQDGWPYVQHRGGPKGFLKVLDERHIGFADFRGNRQFMSAGNVARNDRVALILVDYPARRRLKLIGHARREAAEQVLDLMPEDYAAMPWGAFVIEVAAFDWNCPQHITPRWTAEDLMHMRKDGKWPEV
ncbi:pyridoxamine 5'-phosphate oxidase family protein [Novosphingobium mangrovi (ex Huang et al. 2023)]|uniref:Pyridoxamine 5'-phosphate oxidase family protein n=1 Tax=Novosphingobium mangrovi (ex Huang et al. 2023) TaxID=2976432 RepID=A0ABT2I9T5_9SPHN|nr:pyridoxamine 5'-phosphate oxidase family protein [Novosphingobium mangrovi (ex Huang et al. 2023)]MCT2401556.1 pyridoxamine 5'-phosphate oxidase family protein [Novosphingobium mangrovi (ex Huang et al. 2023)]